jgi:NAD(P)-dependent dehydrogenase (short-subunit alcohol dehydrogenase family)
MLFENKVVLITGGGSGIGRAAALSFAREAGKVLLGDINSDGAAETVKMIEAAGGIASYIKTDVSQAKDVQAMVDAAITRYGGLDVAVNNAGIADSLTRFQQVSEETYDLVMNVNVKGVWLCIKHEIDAMLKNADGGNIINTASVAGLVGAPKLAVYSASKHAVIGLTKSAALELTRKNIRVNAVCPSYINTPMTSDFEGESAGIMDTMLQYHPMKRLGSPEEVAEAILWLASDKASFVNGVALATDGGFTA